MSKPNIIYILSDQHNAAVMGASGDKYVKTPNLDKLAQSGTMLANCYCNSPLCVPSRSSLLTSLLPHKTGILNNMQSLPTDKITMAHSLTVAGYDTVLSGRMHFNGPDQRHGYEKRFVGDLTPSFPGIDNEEEIYGDLKRTSNQSKISIEKSGGGSSAVLLFDKDVVDEACSYINNREDERPLFMTVGLYGPHCPYICPEDLFDYYYETLPEPEEITKEYRESVHKAIQDWYSNRDLNDITVEDVRRVRAAYYGMVQYMDGLVGKVLQTVESKLGLENTIIVYGSDHGDNIGANGLFWKTNFYEGSSKVPMIFSWKNKISTNKQIDQLTSLIDIAPTLIDMAKGPELPVMDGESLLDALMGVKQLDDERIVISELGDIKGDMPSAMICKNDYKLVLHYGYDSPQLFNIKRDPMEKNDLATQEEYADICKNMEALLRKQWSPEEAYKEFIIAKNNGDILKTWANIINVEPIEEWRGDISKNYISRKIPVSLATKK